MVLIRLSCCYWAACTLDSTPPSPLTRWRKFAARAFLAAAFVGEVFAYLLFSSLPEPLWEESKMLFAVAECYKSYRLSMILPSSL